MITPAMLRQPAALALACVLGLVSVPAWADVEARFIESAPKDRFEITNRSTCALTQADVTIDLSGSAAGLLFDVTNQGAGVDVFQPFELVAGAQAVASHSTVKDGDRQVTLLVRQWAPGAQIAFTIDVDDTVDARGITISGSEIEGAVVRVNRNGAMHSARFSRDGTALIKMPACG